MNPAGSSSWRIASLVPSLTELMFALGLGDALVARTGFCIHPKGQVERVAKVGGTKDVNLEKLRRLAPTHVLVNVDENRLETIEAIRGWPSPPEIVVTHPLGPADVPPLIDALANRFVAPRVAARAHALIAAIEGELERTVAAGRSPLRVLYLVWHEPWMTVARDTYISRMLARVGWHTWPDVEGGESGRSRYPTLDGHEPWLHSIDLVLLSTEPFAFGPAQAEAAHSMCAGARVISIDGERLGWYGAQTAPGLAYLRALADDNAAAPRWTT